MKIFKGISLFAMLFIALTSYAQVNPKEGYIVTNQQDTIYGLVDFRTNEINSKQCYFKANDAQEFVKYGPTDITAYRFKETGKYFVSKKFDKEEPFFAEFLVKGMLNLYRKEIGFRKIYYVENQDGHVESYEEMEVNIDYDSRQAKARAQGLYRQVYQSQQAVNDIKIGSMTDKQMIKMVRDYHEDVCTSNTECIQFEHDTKSDKQKWSPTIYVGQATAFCSDYKILDGIKSAAGYVIGAGIDYDRARSGKGLIFQFSMLYSKLYNLSTPKFVKSTERGFINLGLMFRYPTKKKIKLTTRYGIVVGGFYPYVGCGLELPIQKHALNFNIEYKCLNYTKLNILQANVGFRI